MPDESSRDAIADACPTTPGCAELRGSRVVGWPVPLRVDRADSELVDHVGRAHRVATGSDGRRRVRARTAATSDSHRHRCDRNAASTAPAMPDSPTSARIVPIDEVLLTARTLAVLALDGVRRRDLTPSNVRQAVRPVTRAAPAGRAGRSRELRVLPRLGSTPAEILDRAVAMGLDHRRVHVARPAHGRGLRSRSAVARMASRTWTWPLCGLRAVRARSRCWSTLALRPTCGTSWAVKSVRVTSRM